MYRVAVCDDEREGREETERLAGDIMAELNIEYAIDCFDSCQALLEAIETRRTYHLLLLDILFDGPEGMGLAQALREQRSQCSIIFISNTADYVLDGYGVRAVNYILKPPDRSRLTDAVRYAYRHSARPDEQLVLAGKGELRAIPQNDILYIESKLHDVFVHLHGGEAYQCRMALEKLEEQLPACRFSRSHRSYCVNLEHVRGMCGGEVLLAGGGRVPLSRSRYAVFRRAYLEFQSE